MLSSLQDNDELNSKASQQSLMQLASMLTTQSQQQTTSLPPLITTSIGLNEYIESLAQQQSKQLATAVKQQQQYNNQNQNMYLNQQYGADSVGGESMGSTLGDEIVSVATTINNHGNKNNNNQQLQFKQPSQYVDVSGLIGVSFLFFCLDSLVVL